MAWQLQDAVQFCQDNDADSVSVRDIRVYKRLANDKRAHMSTLLKAPFERRLGRLVFDAIKTTGTVSVAVGSPSVTGVGTAFATPDDVGKLFRGDGEPETYEISAAPSATALTLAENYEGQAALVADTFEVIDVKQALPTRFRIFEEDVLYTMDAWPLKRCEPNEIDQMLAWERANGQPYVHCVRSSGTNPSGYLWIYPAPSQKTIIQFNYYQWAAEAVNDTDEFGLPQTPAAIQAHRQLILAGLLQFQKKPFMEDLRLGEEMAREAMKNEQRSGSIGARNQWGTPDGSMFPRRMPGNVDSNP